ncbi:hypothetical protein [Tianweitania sediminis]|uniref:Uncharacterized protein n=1 Tax=Tianweitania sediminis TaxID=1502156 RepID=A0A8J7UKK1_9HYPH|nr:hypothetical protein [Tianweitania sediminis]MBP0439950.1 hypothetical protein [Tianweitania sediminis]
MEKAIGLAADEPAGVWRLRERLAASHVEFDRLVSERWDALCGRATSTFEETVDPADGCGLALAIHLERYRVSVGSAPIPLSARLLPMLTKGR